MSDLVTILLKNVLNEPAAGRNLISCSALRADGYQTIFPQPDKGGVYPSGIYKCKEGEDSEEQAIPIVQIGNLFFIKDYPQLRLSRPERKENLWLSWSKRLGYASITSLRSMLKTCRGLEGLKLAPIPYGYVSAEARMGKARNLDAP
jgi:hypothetical protein